MPHDFRRSPLVWVPPEEADLGDTWPKTKWDARTGHMLSPRTNEYIRHWGFRGCEDKEVEVLPHPSDAEESGAGTEAG